ncbi:tRNA (adenosine(37)-N6)-dimethylallyltransferase MiaA [Metallumcola ferriviriculae]|uniref:tRNA dimethylallyltransferase n=1 Tax=Metallumcola ferriviriculae TaxID=3039180 RepID=A0AAU0UQ70_9FIRM|nr:tRNA (adenosine(37)-N6)-dimethylallyltransferase MiaA [Desulfitibacteraceae bacterium MK1]
MRLPLAAIVGPTAVGKSAVAVEVADRLNGEIVSADSMQVYRQMDIGTAKISADEMIATGGRLIPHHLINVVSPDEDYSVARYQQDARTLIREVNSRNELPILVGGTGLYVQSVIDPYHFGKEPGDKNIRNKIRTKIKIEGLDKIHQELREVDPQAGEKIHPNDEKRIIRALEYYYSRGERISDNYYKKKISLYNLAMVGLTMDRQLLYQRINKRVDKMIEAGLLDEVRMLLNQGYPRNLPAMQGLGYKQMAAFCVGDLSWDEAIRVLKRDTRRFAKRQLTWFRRDERIVWIDVSHMAEDDIICKITEYICRTL